MNIPFNKPFLTGQELSYIQDAHDRGQLAGDGHYTKLCHDWLEEYIPGSKALLTHSCTAALEIAALLLDIKSGDEIIMPSYTFVSTANAFVLRGAIPVFVDISPDTLKFTLEQMEWMQTTPLSELRIGDSYLDQHGNPCFNLSKEGSDAVGLIASGRASSMKELRGNLLRDLLTAEQSKPGADEKTIFQFLDDYSKNLATHTDWQYIQNAWVQGQLSGEQGVAQGFSEEGPIFEALKADLEARALAFANQFHAALEQSPNMQKEDGSLTQKGKNTLQSIINKVNADPAFPKDLAQFLQTTKTLEAKLIALDQQLQKGIPFEQKSAEHTALSNFHKELSGAYHTHLKDASKEDFNPNAFKEACHEALKKAEQSPLKHQRGLWAKFLKPLLLVVGVVCTLGTALAHKGIRETVSKGIQNINEDTAGLKTVQDFKQTLQGIKAKEEQKQKREEPDEPNNDASIGGSAPT